MTLIQGHLFNIKVTMYLLQNLCPCCLMLLLSKTGPCFIHNSLPAQTIKFQRRVVTLVKLLQKSQKYHLTTNSFGKFKVNIVKYQRERYRKTDGTIYRLTDRRRGNLTYKKPSFTDRGLMTSVSGWIIVLDIKWII